MTGTLSVPGPGIEVQSSFSRGLWECAAISAERAHRPSSETKAGDGGNSLLLCVLHQ